MNRKKRRELNKQMVKNRPDRLTEIPKEDWENLTGGRSKNRIQVFISKDYLVQIFSERDDVKRMSINRNKINAQGHWEDNLTWDEIQRIKAECGYGFNYAIEVYPRAQDVVNVANMRHIWILDEPLDIGWFAGIKS